MQLAEYELAESYVRYAGLCLVCVLLRGVPSGMGGRGMHEVHACILCMYVCVCSCNDRMYCLQLNTIHTHSTEHTLCAHTHTCTEREHTHTHTT